MSIDKSIDPVNIIQTTQKLRLQIIDALTSDGLTMPTDGKDVNTLAGLLRDLDANALTTRKLDVEEKGVDAATKAAANVAAVLREMGGNPFKGVRDSGAIVSSIPKPDMELLPVVEMVPGHGKQGEDKLAYDEFVVDDKENG